MIAFFCVAPTNILVLRLRSFSTPSKHATPKRMSNKRSYSTAQHETSAETSTNRDLLALASFLTNRLRVEPAQRHDRMKRDALAHCMLKWTCNMVRATTRPCERGSDVFTLEIKLGMDLYGEIEQVVHHDQTETAAHASMRRMRRMRHAPRHRHDMT